MRFCFWGEGWKTLLLVITDHVSAVRKLHWVERKMLWEWVFIFTKIVNCSCCWLVATWISHIWWIVILEVGTQDWVFLFLMNLWLAVCSLLMSFLSWNAHVLSIILFKLNCFALWWPSHFANKLKCSDGN